MPRRVIALKKGAGRHLINHAKRPQQGRLTLVRNESGQLIIFYSVALITIIGIMAFIVNVGLFVRAKINLQNAVDAAAWSGAAVQSRQLTNISYMNWELRNVYKEWMFKYYVLGEISLPKTRPPDFTGASGNNMDFRLDQFTNPNGTTSPAGDFFNFPSICIHFASTFNICKIYSVPGLPRFEAVGFPGLDETHNNFIDTIVQTKAKDCSRRTKFNFLTAASWAYGNGNSNLMQDTPQVATNRVGAWPRAFELGLRIRNLEKIVNEPPHPQALCNGGSGCTDINNLDQGGATDLPINERKIKAFWSGLRALGINESDELKANFKLTEVPPQPFSPPDTSLSAMLIPQTASKEKYYLDLIAQVVNYATFYSAFVASTAQANAAGAVEAQGECGVTKTALPVPGYVMGFFKNPNVATYYAVTGESKYIGLFFPFTETEGVTIKAYAAAKPFGGRIGPKLFDVTSQNVTARDYRGKSAPYITGIDIGNNSDFVQGFPVPLSTDFWATSPGETIGGRDNSASKFGIPNMIYDVADGLQNQQGGATGKINIVSNQAVGTAPDISLGLYDKRQYELLANNLSATGTISDRDIQIAIIKARGPTRYDALNYLIPTIGNNGSNPRIDAPDTVVSAGAPSPLGDPNIITYSLFAPLFGFGSQTFYPNLDAVQQLLQEFIDTNESAKNTYLSALAAVANAIRGQGSGQLYETAANSIHNGSNPTTFADCTSIAGTFDFFWRSDVCPAPNQNNLRLRDSIIELWQNQPAEFAMFHTTTYYRPSVSNADLMTGYLPGPRTGADADGTVAHPFLSGAETFLSRRNSYSTKFIPMSAVTPNGSNRLIGSFGMLGEGSTDNNNLSDVQFRNPIDSSVLSEFGELFF